MLSNFNSAFAFIVCLFASSNLKAQADTVYLAFEDVLKIAQESSYLATNSRLAWEANSAQLKIYKLSNLPSLKLNTTVPNFTQSISTVTQPDGIDAFVTRNQANSSLSLSLVQPVVFTGGNLSISGNINRIDLFGSNQQVSYSSAPFNLSYGQSLFNYNPYFDQKKANSLKEQKLIFEFTQALENINVQASKLYFNLYMSQVRYHLASQNLSHFGKLLKIAKEQLDAARISEIDFTQIELSLLDAQLEKKKSNANIFTAELALKKFLKMPKGQLLRVFENTSVPALQMDKEKILTQAESINKLTNSDIRKIESKINFNQGYNKLITSDVSLSLGTNSSSADFDNLFNNLQQRQSISFTLKMPIFDWGLRKEQNNVTKMKWDLDIQKIIEDYNGFEIELLDDISTIEEAQEYSELCKKTIALCERQIQQMQEVFKSGKIPFSDLVRVINKRSEVYLTLVNNCDLFWEKLFSIRSKSLYDPISQSMVELRTPSRVPFVETMVK